MGMKQSLKELINGLEEPKDNGLRFRNDTNQFIEEAKGETIGQRGRRMSLSNSSRKILIV